MKSNGIAFRSSSLSAIFLFNLSGKGDVPIETKRTYICGLGARIECEPLSEHSTHSDRVTDYRFSSLFRAWLRLLNTSILNQTSIFLRENRVIIFVSFVKLMIKVRCSFTNNDYSGEKSDEFN